MCCGNLPACVHGACSYIYMHLCKACRSIGPLANLVPSVVVGRDGLAGLAPAPAPASDIRARLTGFVSTSNMTVTGILVASSSAPSLKAINCSAMSVSSAEQTSIPSTSANRYVRALNPLASACPPGATWMQHEGGEVMVWFPLRFQASPNPELEQQNKFHVGLHERCSGLAPHP